jgi:hypothetical protein
MRVELENGEVIDPTFWGKDWMITCRDSGSELTLKLKRAHVKDVTMRRRAKAILKSIGGWAVLTEEDGYRVDRVLLNNTLCRGYVFSIEIIKPIASKNLDYLAPLILKY